MRKKKIDTIGSPKSVCMCGHDGDGPGSPHGGIIGHGPCYASGCACKKFTWKAYNANGNALLAAHSRKARGKT